MKVLQLFTEKCVACHTCEETCSLTYFKEKSPDLSRIRILNNASYTNITVCSQCGACIGICPTGALERDANGVVQLRKAKCTGCLMCTGFCPSAAMFFTAKQVEPFKCIACGLCAKKCPTGALELINTPKA